MPAPPAAEFLELQRVLAGRYSLDREIGRGGMGVVFLARDVALDRPVAIKLLPADLAQQPMLRERFLREARTAAQLSHPHVVPIHAVEEREGLVYFVMSYVEGETLGQRVRRAGPLPAAAVSRIVRDVAWALGYAHARGIVHRDVKPDNVLLDRDSGRAMVTDFGIARVATAEAVTSVGEIVGTAHYMSPEQASASDIDGRSDLFSLGVTAYYALTGTLPFEGPTLPAVVARIVTQPAPRVGTVRPGLPTVLAESVDRCLAKDPEQRFATGEALAEAVAGAAQETATAPQLRAVLQAWHETDPALGMLLLAVLVMPTMYGALWTTQPGDVWFLGGMFLLLSTWAPVKLLLATRQAIGAGFGPEDLQRSVQRAVLAAQEEREVVWKSFLDSEPRMLRRVKRWRLFAHASLAVGAASFAVGALTHSLHPHSATLGIGLVGSMLALLGYGAGLGVGRAARRKRTGGRTFTEIRALALGPAVGKWLFRVAGLGLHVQRQNAPAESEHTEVFLAAAADDLFNRLPPKVKKRFPGAPALMRKLEAEAERLRAREGELGRLAAEANPDGEEGPRGGTRDVSDAVRNDRRQAAAREMEAARAGIRERLASAVAAMENIRLDLLRLQAGVGAESELTAALDAAQAIGTAVDAAVVADSDAGRVA
jgi:eukaryotic-like serine/threonine-protein kinase